MAGGIVGDSTASAVTGAQSGKNAIENNQLSPDKQKSRSEELAAYGADNGCKAGVREIYAKEYDKVQERINSCSTTRECVAVAKEMKQWHDYAGYLQNKQKKPEMRPFCSCRQRPASLYNVLIVVGFPFIAIVFGVRPDSNLTPNRLI